VTHCLQRNVAINSDGTQKVMNDAENRIGVKGTIRETGIIQVCNDVRFDETCRLRNISVKESTKLLSVIFEMRKQQKVHALLKIWVTFSNEMQHESKINAEVGVGLVRAYHCMQLI